MKKIIPNRTKVAAAIRKNLKTNFPNTKFTLRTFMFENNEEVNIYWMDGPSQDYVCSIVNRYQYEPAANAKNKILKVQYIFTHRKVSYEFAVKIAEKLNKKLNSQIKIIKSNLWDWEVENDENLEISQAICKESE